MEHAISANSSPGRLIAMSHGATSNGLDDSAVVRHVRDQRMRGSVLVGGACLIIFLIVDSMTARHIEKMCSQFIEWVAINPELGILAVVLVYALATICFVPGSILTIGTGYAFGRAMNDLFLGVLLSSTAVFIGASLGSISCLLLGRYLFREPVMRLADRFPTFRAIDRALEGNGFKIMLLLRLSPLIPYNALDYISGVTSISIRHYSMALIGLLPGAITLCYVGATASSLTEGTSQASENTTLRLSIIIFGLFFAFAGAAVASYYSKIELDKIMLQENPDTDPLSNANTTDRTPYQDNAVTMEHELT